MLKNEPILGIRGVDTAEIWLSEVWYFEYDHLLPPPKWVAQPCGAADPLGDEPGGLAGPGPQAGRNARRHGRMRWFTLKDRIEVVNRKIESFQKFGSNSDNYF